MNTSQPSERRIGASAFINAWWFTIQRRRLGLILHARHRCRRRESNPHRVAPPDFESGASTSSATPAPAPRVAGSGCTLAVAGGGPPALRSPPWRNAAPIVASPPSAAATSLGIRNSELAWPWASCGSASMYLSASRSGVGLPAWIAAKTVWIAWLSPSARRIAAWRSPSASRICACFCASARRIAPWRSPSARRICDCFSPSASSTVARFARSPASASPSPPGSRPAGRST